MLLYDSVFCVCRHEARRPAQVFAGTWNVAGEAVAGPADLRAWLRPDGAGAGPAEMHPTADSAASDEHSPAGRC